MSKIDKRERILEAAHLIFWEKGFHQATVEAIAQKAGIGKGTIYQYFSSKQDIFVQLTQWYVETYFENITANLQQEVSFAENLDRLLTAHFENLEPLLQYMRQSVYHENECNGYDKEAYGHIEEIINNTRTMIGTMIEASIARGELRYVESEVVTHFIMGILSGTAHAMLKSGEKVNKDSAKNELKQLILYGIANDNA